ncbi:MAG: AAA family ATPase, partial [Holosporales bacterium]|nr:AAA family ATPase [Holosporales bacterium]
RLAEKGEYSRLVAHNEGVRQKNIEILCERPEAIIHEVSSKRTVFTRAHLEDEIVRRVGGHGQLLAILKQKLDGLENPGSYALNENFASDIASDMRQTARRLTDRLLQDPEIAQHVGENLEQDPLCASTAYKNQEEKLVGLADQMHARSSKTLSESAVASAIKAREQELGFALSEEQHAAIQHLFSGSDIRILNGRAGTGKTTLLKAVAEAYQNAGYRVLGTSFQGKAVEIMGREIGIPSQTLDSLFVAWQRHAQQKQRVESGRLWGKPYLYAFQKMKELETHRLSDKDVILLDEANMIGGRLWEGFLEEASAKGAKVLIIQDTAQIKSREPGDYGRLFAERFGTAETYEVMRQRTDWQKTCAVLLNEGRTREGLLPYQEKGHIHWQETGDGTKDALVQAYVEDGTRNPNATRMALAYRNRDVEAINQGIRSTLKEQGLLGDTFVVKAQEFAIGDRVRFTQNDHHGRFVKNTHESFL